MVILHIADIENSLFSGVSVAVPQHIKAQAKLAKVAFINVNNTPIDGVDGQIDYESCFDLKKLPEPFSCPDVVVFHEVYYPRFLGISRNLRQHHVPYVVIPHGCLRREAQNRKWLKKKMGNLLLFNRFISGAVAVQCLSKLELEATPFGKQKFVGTNGVRMPSHRKMSFRAEGTRFVYIGRLDFKVKGLDLMLEAVRLKADFLRKNQCQLDMYGPDQADSKEALKNMIREKNIGDIVQLNREVSGKQKEEILLNGDVFLQTSRHEGMPMGILEALSYGIPCLITKGTNLGEAVETVDAGWMAETDAQSIAELLEKAVLERNSWQRKGQNAIAFIESNFAWNVVAAETVEKYKQLIEQIKQERERAYGAPTKN